MSGLFSKPKMPDIPQQEEEIEPVVRVQEEAELARRRERKKLLKGGRKTTILSGIESALQRNLKKRLGE